MKMTLKTLPSAVGQLDSNMVDDEPDSQPCDIEEDATIPDATSTVKTAKENPATTAPCSRTSRVARGSR